MIISLLMSSLCANAQVNNVFADIGLPLDSHIGGLSLTYNRKLVRKFGVGIGAQEYYLSVGDNSSKLVNQFTPTLFADLRGYFGHRKSRFLLFADFGLDFKRNTDTTKFGPVHGNGFYCGAGLGYFCKVTKTGMGPYVTLKFVSDTYSEEEYNTVTQQRSSATLLSATSVIAVGFKF